MCWTIQRCMLTKHWLGKKERKCLLLISVIHYFCQFSATQDILCGIHPTATKSSHTEGEHLTVSYYQLMGRLKHLMPRANGQIETVNWCPGLVGGTFQSLIWGGSAPRSNPLPFDIPFWLKSHPFYAPFIAKRNPFHIPTLGSLVLIFI